MSCCISNEANPRDETTPLIKENSDPSRRTITGLEARHEERKNTLREFMKEARKENQELRMPMISLHSSRLEAAETAVGESQTAQ